MVKSKYLTNQQDWEERCRVMECNLEDGYFDFLFFNIELNLIDAIDNADYDKQEVLMKMKAAFKRGAFNAIRDHIEHLRDLI